MNKSANRTTAIKSVTKSADKSIPKTTDKSTTKSTDKSTPKSTATVKSDDKSSNYGDDAEEMVPEHNPNCQCLGDCNCIRLRTSESVSDEDGPGICIDFQPQHLVIDFTPSEELDTATSVESCLRLWELLANVPEWAKALDSEASTPVNDLSPRSETEEPPPPEQESDHMAVSILNLMDKAGVTVPVFEARETTPYCVDEKQDYFQVPEQVSSSLLPVRVSVKYNVDGRPSIEKKKPKPKKPIDVKSMVTQLDSWDDCHPKSMEPPGHPPETASMIKVRRQKTYGPCQRDCKECARHECKNCGCHQIEFRHEI